MIFVSPDDVYDAQKDGFRRCGELVAQAGLPTIVLQEGGYDVPNLGINAQSWLTGLGA